MIIDGRAIANKIVNQLKKETKPTKKLVAILVGDNPSSISFLKQKQKLANELGIEFELIKFTEINEEDLIIEIEKINKDDSIGGVIIQLPLPSELNKNNILLRLSPQKDVDALTNQALVMPLSVEVVKDILKEQNYSLEDKIIAVIGQGELIGKPITNWLEKNYKKPIIVDIGDDINKIKRADLVISGVGKSGLIDRSNLKEGANVI
ncbi:bifunctional 5,10-methylenetetrahydrofolate dehydrogenase/5,10-methenyltetrahydrofolate cyclohydrolase, partial [Candidatus Wolfebacteria bacterium]|nr:bifunctional 5,10-methylenetetrahydrofolate dehydrogenase/5,10-methenyltetrahydrofolate cyclohydrolase [Candidatus Wolfebacteria bacterium]